VDGGMNETLGAEMKVLAHERGANPILVVAKIRRVLDAFVPNAPQLTLTEVARASDLPTSTCMRILQALVAEGFLDKRDERYSLGIGLLRWTGAILANSDIAASAVPVVQALRDQTSETAYLYTRVGDVRVCVYVAETRQAVGRIVKVGQAAPMHAGSAGKVFLAYDPQLFSRVIAHDRISYTENTITSPEDLEAEAAGVRSKGYAVSFGEHLRDGASISAPIFDAFREVIAAIGITAPTDRLNESLVEAYAPAVVSAADSVSTAMGLYRDVIAP
jgi:IclR family transcriptional regulator, acetate operon repressor